MDGCFAHEVRVQKRHAGVALFLFSSCEHMLLLSSVLPMLPSAPLAFQYMNSVLTEFEMFSKMPHDFIFRPQVILEEHSLILNSRVFKVSSSLLF